MGAIQEDHDHDAVVGQPVDSADTGDPELEPEPSDHGIDKYPLVGSQLRHSTSPGNP